MPHCRRTDGLLVEELPDETVIYDTTRHEVHCLNRIATFIWNHCDGRTSEAEMARLLRKDLDVAADRATVGLIVEQLEALHLLAKRSAQPAGVVRRSRRAAAKQLAALGLAGLVMTIPVPTAMAAGSGMIGSPCATGAQCVTGCCCQNNSGGLKGTCQTAGACGGNQNCA
jgi:hypothetical protein